MKYVKLFKINGIDTKQVACIELQGAPNAATEGAVGVLGMDMTSPTHEVYRCVAVNGSVYTWELLSAGMSIISATITGEGGETMTFRYDTLRAPANYLVKVGDLILDSEGYLYQITSIGAESCEATYGGTHIGGIASGDKDYRLAVKDGKLQLVTESGRVINKVDYLTEDNDTITRNSKGVASVRGLKTINDTSLRMFVGTRAEYNALTEAQKQGVFAIITDDISAEDWHRTLENLGQSVEDLNTSVGEAVGDLQGQINTITEQVTEGFGDLQGQVNTANENFQSFAQALSNGEAEAGSARIATYASSDTSKGTIEQRLTSLGFKQGATQISSTLGLMGYTVTGRNDHLYRQGNYVWGELGLELSSSGGDSSTSLIIAVLPKEFYPKETHEYVIPCRIYSSFDKTTPRYWCMAKISSDGTVQVSDYRTEDPTASLVELYIRFGYEAAPL